MSPIRSTLQATQFYGILDTGYVSNENWEKKFQALAQGGAKIIQVRAKKQTQAETRALLQRAITAKQTLPSAQQPLLVLNDDLDLCLEFENVGLHVGQEDISASEARKRLGPDRILGLSTHSPKQAQDAMELRPTILDYFAVGPVFATQTKPDYTPVGLKLVEWVSTQKPELPFFCIGGINRKNAHQVAAAGGKRIVTVSDVLLADDTAAAVRDSIACLEQTPPSPSER